MYSRFCIYFFIYNYKPKQKNNEKEENSSDGLAEAGWNLEIWDKDEREMKPVELKKSQLVCFFTEL